MNTSARVFCAILSVFALFTTGCRKSEESALPATSAVGPIEVRTDTSSRSEAVSQGSVSHTPYAVQATSWSEQLRLVPEQDRALLMALNERYFGALSFNSPEEHTKLLALGFPTVDEWLAANKLTDTKLAQLAKSGNIKAKALYADRAISNLEKLKAVAPPAATRDHERILIDASTMSTYMADQALEANRSAFAAYVLGRQRATLYGSQEPLFAALMVGRDLGDRRANSLAMKLPRTGLDGAAIVVMYDSMLGRLGR